MGAKSSCAKTLFQTPVGSLSCDACGSSCVKDTVQESPEQVAQRAIVDHTMQVISRLLGSESAHVQNNFAGIVKELLAAGTDPSTIRVEHELHSPQPFARRMSTRIVFQPTPPATPKQQGNIVLQPLPRTLYPVESREEKSETDDPPPLHHPPLIRQNATNRSPPFKVEVHSMQQPRLDRQKTI
jgi:hypothetical protein